MIKIRNFFGKIVSKIYVTYDENVSIYNDSVLNLIQNTTDGSDDSGYILLVKINEQPSLGC